MTKYVANPNVVDAFRITEAGEPDSNGTRRLALDDGAFFDMTPAITSRGAVVAGDYLVQSHDSDTWVVERAVFEARYSLLELTEQAPACEVFVDESELFGEPQEGGDPVTDPEKEPV